jgi:hypothetical protein
MTNRKKVKLHRKSRRPAESRAKSAKPGRSTGAFAYTANDAAVCTPAGLHIALCRGNDAQESPTGRAITDSSQKQNLNFKAKHP